MTKKAIAVFSFFTLIFTSIASAQTADTKTVKELDNECYALVKEKLNFLKSPILQTNTKSFYREGATSYLIDLGFVAKTETGANTFWLGFCEVQNRKITSVEIKENN